MTRRQRYIMAALRALTLLALVGSSGCTGVGATCERLHDVRLDLADRCIERDLATVDVESCRSLLPEGCTRVDLDALNAELDCTESNLGRLSPQCESTPEWRECMEDVPELSERCWAVLDKLYLRGL